MPENMARHIIGETSLWEAGIHLLQAGDPDAWRSTLMAIEMRSANQDAIAARERVVRKVQKTVRCSIRIKSVQQ